MISLCSPDDILRTINPEGGRSQDGDEADIVVPTDGYLALL